MKLQYFFKTLIIILLALCLLCPACPCFSLRSHRHRPENGLTVYFGKVRFISPAQNFSFIGWQMCHPRLSLP